MKEKEDIISMDNGCVCCTVRGDLVRALLTLKDLKKKFDAVIIETTGLADPRGAFVLPQPGDCEAYRIDSILCLADANTWRCTWKAGRAVNEACQVALQIDLVE